MNDLRASPKIVAVVPAKGSSERIPSKNLMKIDGEPLVARQIRRLIEFDLFNEVWIDSDSEEIFSTCAHLNCKKLYRSPALATNSTDGNSLFMHAVQNIDCDILVQVLCTSPFLSKESIKAGIDAIASDQFDSVVAGTTPKLYQWINKVPKYDIFSIPNSSVLESVFVESMGLYAMRANTAKVLKRRIGDNPLFLNLSASEAVDINFPDDLQLANFIADGMRAAEVARIRSMGPFLSSAILSDILDEIGVKDCVYCDPFLRPNFKDAFLFGRAKTLKIVKFDDKQHKPDSIYDAMRIYDYIRPSDVLVVDTEVPEFAFFGELNCNLAVRSGASGAIINGVTRDSSATKNRRFPVFAKGTKCIDVKTRGAFGGINWDVRLGTTVIVPGDLIFADSEGLIRIPRKMESDVLTRALDVLIKEKGILQSIVAGVDSKELINRFGHF